MCLLRKVWRKKFRQILRKKIFRAICANMGHHPQQPVVILRYILVKTIITKNCETKEQRESKKFFWKRMKKSEKKFEKKKAKREGMVVFVCEVKKLFFNVSQTNHRLLGGGVAHICTNCSRLEPLNIEQIKVYRR